MNLLKLFRKGEREDVPDFEELFKARFSEGFVLNTTPEEYDSKLLGISISNIFSYKNMYNEIKKFELEHDLFSKETIEFKQLVNNSAPDKYEFDLYCNYIRRRGIKKITLYDSEKLGEKLSKVFLYEYSFNIITHIIEVFGPNSSKAKECYANQIAKIDNIYDWERFYSYKINSGCLEIIRRKYVKQLMSYEPISNVTYIKRGREYNEHYKTVQEYSDDTIKIVFSKDKLSVFIYNNDISKDMIEAIAYGSLKTYYYKQFGVIFIIMCFPNIPKITFYINTKNNIEASDEWIRGKSNRVEIWLIDRVEFRLKAWAYFELNAIPNIKRCLRIEQKSNTKEEIESNASDVIFNYNTDRLVELSVYSESIIGERGEQ